jgi:succinate dehydrogenase/fumarate reductase-like Fe-S protein
MKKNVPVQIWMQDSTEAKGRFVMEEFRNVTESTLLFQALDEMNDRRVREGKRRLHFACSCREGSCGSCVLFICGFIDTVLTNGKTACKTRVVEVIPKKGILTLEPLPGFAVERDLAVKRDELFDVVMRLLAVGCAPGSAPETRGQWRDYVLNELAIDGGSCISCGRCRAACPRGAAMLPFAGLVVRLANASPNDRVFKEKVRASYEEIEAYGLGQCGFNGLCAEVCPADLDINLIQFAQRQILRSTFTPR